ncbi:MAG TPA: DUF1800 domain-containing protein [Pyrinomonadaceae bacterium]|jgi:uncharacterized protein (DUF1800 family)|nr:DUF1800 domain-containing protein [Pyrinomonadaceae bacterium]
MKIKKGVFHHSIKGTARRAAAFLCVLALLTGSFVARAQQQGPQGRLSEDRRILHVLNRLGYGARPGDVERVRALGLENYIRQQLEPEKIADTVAEEKVRGLTTLSLSTAELYAKYPQPGALLRQLERRGELPPELAALRENRVKGKGAATDASATAIKPDDEAMMRAGPEGAPRAGDAATAENNGTAGAGNNNEYRRALRLYMEQKGLRRPQRIIAELQAARVMRAVYSERQLQEVLVDFWSNHFNIFAGKGADRWLLVSYDRDTIRPHTLGKFSELLVATAQSPAMLFYLDNFQSVSPNASQGRRPTGGRRGLFFDQLMRGAGGNRRARLNPDDSRQGAAASVQTTPRSTLEEQEEQQQQPTRQQPQRARRGINENYARELMELHTLGVDGGYTQRDVQEVARCFTGWTIVNARGFRNMNAGGGEAGTFYFNPRLHDDGEKVVLGHRIPAGGGMRDGLMVLDILARHPSTAKFIATKLARRFVMDEPTPQLVARLSSVFTRSGGDIRETLRALFASPEFNSPASYRAKIKTPFELAVSAVRTLGGDTDGASPIHQWIARMGEPLYGYQAPTGYPDRAENWVNTGALLERLNFGLALASNRIPGTSVDLSRFNGTAAANSSTDTAKVMERFLDVIVQGDISPQTKATLLRQLSEPAPETTLRSAETEARADAMAQPRRGRRREQREFIGTVDLQSTSNPQLVRMVGLILGSPEFQRQ